MILSTQDTELFFNLMWSLQNFVNLKLGIVPNIYSIDDYILLPSSQKFSVRDALYDNLELIDAYLEENPQNLSSEKLEIIRGWKEFVRDDYFIERTLKKYAIFIGENKVYGVIALYETFEDVLHNVTLPYYVNAVLLPFKGQIIYDGMLKGYATSFGGGIKLHLKEIYMAAKQNGKIIESFDPNLLTRRTKIDDEQIRILNSKIDELLKQVKTLHASNDSPAIHSPAFNLIKTSISFAKMAVDNPDNVDDLLKELKKIERAITKAETVLFREKIY